MLIAVHGDRSHSLFSLATALHLAMISFRVKCLFPIYVFHLLSIILSKSLSLFFENQSYFPKKYLSHFVASHLLGCSCIHLSKSVIFTNLYLFPITLERSPPLQHHHFEIVDLSLPTSLPISARVSRSKFPSINVQPYSFLAFLIVSSSLPSCALNF